MKYHPPLPRANHSEERTDEPRAAPFFPIHGNEFLRGGASRRGTPFGTLRSRRPTVPTAGPPHAHVLPLLRPPRPSSESEKRRKRRTKIRTRSLAPPSLSLSLSLPFISVLNGMLWLAPLCCGNRSLTLLLKCNAVSFKNVEWTCTCADHVAIVALPFQRVPPAACVECSVALF